MTVEQAEIAAYALREHGHDELADALETQAREQAYREKWQYIYENDLQDLY